MKKMHIDWQILLMVLDNMVMAVRWRDVLLECWLGATKQPEAIIPIKTTLFLHDIILSTCRFTEM